MSTINARTLRMTQSATEVDTVKTMSTINARTLRMKADFPAVRFDDNSLKPGKTVVNKSGRTGAYKSDSSAVVIKRIRDFISNSHAHRQQHHPTRLTGSSLDDEENMSLYLKSTRCPRSNDEIYRGLQKRILDALKDDQTETEEEEEDDENESDTDTLEETTKSRSVSEVNEADHITKRSTARSPAMINNAEIPTRSNSRSLSARHDAVVPPNSRSLSARHDAVVPPNSRSLSTRHDAVIPPNSRSLSARYDAVVPPPYRVPLQRRYPQSRRQSEIELTRAANEQSFNADDVEPDVHSEEIRNGARNCKVPFQININASASKSFNELSSSRHQNEHEHIGTSEARKRRGSVAQSVYKDTSTRIPFCAYEDCTRQRLKSATSSSRTSRSYVDIKGEFMTSVSANLKRTQGLYDDVFKARRKFGSQLVFLGKKIDNRERCPRSVLSKDMRQKYTDIKNEYLRLCQQETTLKNQITNLHSEIYMIQNKGYGYQKKSTSLTVITFDPNTSDLSCPSTPYPPLTQQVNRRPKTSSIINDTNEQTHAQKLSRPKSPTRNGWIYREAATPRKAKTPKQRRRRKKSKKVVLDDRVTIKQPVVELQEAPTLEAKPLK